MMPCCSHVTASSRVPQRYSLLPTSFSVDVMTLGMVFDITDNNRSVATRNTDTVLIWVFLCSNDIGKMFGMCLFKQHLSSPWCSSVSQGGRFYQSVSWTASTIQIRQCYTLTVKLHPTETKQVFSVGLLLLYLFTTWARPSWIA